MKALIVKAIKLAAEPQFRPAETRALRALVGIVLAYAGVKAGTSVGG